MFGLVVCFTAYQLFSGSLVLNPVILENVLGFKFFLYSNIFSWYLFCFVEKIVFCVFNFDLYKRKGKTPVTSMFGEF